MSPLLRLGFLLHFVWLSEGFYCPSVETNRHRTAGSGSTTTNLYDIKVFSKKRARVVLDPKTGYYRPAPKDVGEDKAAKRKKRKEGPNLWDSIKESIYDGVENAASLPNKFRKDDDQGVVDGYEAIQKRVYGSTSPAKRLVKEYQERGSDAAEDDTSKSTAGTDGNLFTKVKGAVYGTIDAAGSIAPSTDNAATERKVVSSFKPVVKPTLGSNKELQSSMSDLNSSNPVKKLIAKNKIADFEREEKDIEEYKKKKSIKEALYRATELVQSTAKDVSKASEEAKKSYSKSKKFVQSIPLKVKETNEAIIAIPEKIQQIPKKIEQKKQEVKKSVDDSIQATKNAVNTVVAIPSKVVATVDKVKETAQRTGQTVDSTVKKGKVLLGLEKPIPRPPETPPPEPLTTSDIGWKVAGGVASTSAKVAWWAGKNVAFLTWKGAKYAIEKGTEAVQKELNATESATAMRIKPSAPTTPSPPPVKPKAIQVERNPDIPAVTKLASTEQPKVEEKEAPKKPSPPATKPKALEVEPNPNVAEALQLAKELGNTPQPAAIEPKDTKQRLAELDKQVEEALKLAEEALKVSETSNSRKSNPTGGAENNKK